MNYYELYLQTRDGKRIVLGRVKSLSYAESWAASLEKQFFRWFEMGRPEDEVMSHYEGSEVMVEDVRNGKVWVI